jgi:CheY-like chemotaxis protein
MSSDLGSHAAAQKPVRPLSGAGSTVPTILHVDDDPNDAELLKAACQASGVDVVLNTVTDGDAAVSYLKRQAAHSDRALYPLPNLVLLDLKMPRMTGFEVLNWIRSQPELTHIRVVILSGSELKDDILTATLSGADGYLVKPLRFEALVNVVRSLVGSLGFGGIRHGS